MYKDMDLETPCYFDCNTFQSLCLDLKVLDNLVDLCSKNNKVLQESIAFNFKGDRLMTTSSTHFVRLRTYI